MPLPRLTWSALAWRHAGPWPRKISVTSSVRRSSCPSPSATSTACGLQEGSRAFLALIGQDLHERDPRGIIDADMDKLPTDALVPVDRAGISSGDAMAHRADATELFDIEMDEFARCLAFVTPDRFGRLQRTELVQPQPAQNTAHGGR